MRKLAAILLFALAACSALAAETRKVRVAFRLEPGYCDTATDGSRDGLYVSWMRRIAAFNKWSVEWVDCKWGEAEAMFRAGKLDLLCGVSANGDHGKSGVVVSRQPVGVWKPSIITMGTSPFEDVKDDGFAGCVIGVPLNHPLVPLVKKQLDTAGAKYSIREFATHAELVRALLAGNVGAILAERTSELRYERVLLSMPATPFYFAAANADLAEDVDNAVAAILDAEPNFSRNMRDSYFPYDRIGEIVFTEAERRWIESASKMSRVFTVDLSPEDGYMKKSDASMGRASGFMGMLLTELSELSGLSFRTVRPLPHEDAVGRMERGGVDLWFHSGCNDDSLHSEKNNFLNIEMPQAACTRRYSNSSITDPSCRIAVWKDDHERLAAYTRIGVSSRIVVCETRLDCLHAILDGRADVLLCSFPAARRMVMENGIDDRIDIRIVDTPRYRKSFPVIISSRADPMFVSVMCKAIGMLTRERMADVEYRAEADEHESPFLSRATVGSIVGSMLLVMAVVIIMVLAASRRHVGTAAHKLKASLEVAQGALNEARRSRMKMQEALDKAEFAAKSKTNFLATMSHEIRTPLNAVIGFSEFLAAPGISEKQVKEYTRSISISANSLLSLINDVLDLSKFESGRTEGLDLRIGECDISMLMEEMENVFRMKASDKGISVSFFVAGGMPRLRLAEARMRQILLNLIGNAVKFTDRGGVEVRANYEGGVFALSVKDSGIGISQTGLKHIFDPFTQDMESRRGKVYAGTGLGLSIVKRLAEASGGGVHVESELGKGSLFTVRIPGVEAIAAPARPVEENPLNAPSRTEFHTALIVDDVAMNRKILGMYCRSLGVEPVASFASAKETLEYLEKGNLPDVVLSDVWMPDMNGPELAAEIAARWPSLVVVAVTADTDAGATFEVKDFKAIVTKPVNAAKLKKLFAELRGN